MSNIKNSASIIRLPIIIAITLICGIFIGAKMFNHGNKVNDIPRFASKFKDILYHIQTKYVDTVNTKQLTEEAINKMLEKLDPHSVYIRQEEIQMARAQLESNFEGIGVEFQIIKDTILVVTPISGGPSEAVGIQAGDKIVKVDDKVVAGTKLTNADVFRYLRGKKGTKVKLGIARRGQKKLLDFVVTRDKIPTFSVDVSYMINSEVGYIKVSRFSESTYDEFKRGLIQLQAKGMKKLILDLRGNPGGYMDRATRMADEFLDGNKLIVYTKGKLNSYNTEHRSYQGNGIFEKGPVIVLIDEGSASASEIVSGALQDNDRALIVGRRSFGKGLVQMPIDLGDSTELRLTISRYYTPSGRSIQKPYGKSEDDYGSDLFNRYKHGEFFVADSIKFDQNLKYKTLRGRTVYGGGGIMPDMFIPRDTSMYTNYLSALFNSGVIRDYTFEYGFSKGKELEKMGFEKYKSEFVVSDAMLKEIVKMGEKAEVKFNQKEYDKSKVFLRNQVKALIARSVWKSEGYYPIINEIDEMVPKALTLFDKAEKIEKGDL